MLNRAGEIRAAPDRQQAGRRRSFLFLFHCLLLRDSSPDPCALSRNAGTLAARFVAFFFFLSNIQFGGKEKTYCKV